jgi:hypothetical protein
MPVGNRAVGNGRLIAVAPSTNGDLRVPDEGWTGEDTVDQDAHYRA